MPGPSYVQVLGGGSPDGGVALLLFFDERRYVFACGEGTQRFCVSHNLRLNRLQAVFLPRLEWTRSGGFPGLLCTVADAGGIERLHLVGPANTMHFVATLRPFLRRSLFELKVSEVGTPAETLTAKDGDRIQDALPLAYSDECIKVYVMEVFDGPEALADSMELVIDDPSDGPPPPPSEAKRRKTPPHHGDFYANASYFAKMFKDLQEKTTTAAAAGEYYGGCEDDHDEGARMPAVRRRGSSLCYLVEGPALPGKFNARRAKELGVPAGPLYSQLTRGLPVELPDGRVVEPEDCVGERLPGSLLLILDVASQGQLHDLSNQLAILTASSTIQSQLNGHLEIVFHLADPDLFHSQSYQTLVVQRLAGHRHVWANGHKSIVYPSPLAILKNLHLSIEADVFPLAAHVDEKAPPSETGVDWAAPLTRLKWNSRDRQSIVDDSMAIVVQQAADAIYDRDFVSSYEPRPDNPVVTFLGTGAALPGKYRNVSSTLVDYGDAAYLLDCGEATLGQLLRRFPEELFHKVLGRLRAILISHLHADHQLGLPGVLCRARTNRELVVVAPQRYSTFLQELSDCALLASASSPPQHHCTLSFFASERIESCAEYRSRAAQASGLASLQAVPVVHCPHSYGFLFDRRHHSHSSVPSPRIIFSGDTRPAASLIAAGHGSQILIHEATFCAALQDEAVAKRHSTVEEAIDVGRQMEVDFTLLSHISQRYAKIIPPHQYAATPSVAIAVDLMSLSWAQMQAGLLATLVPRMLTLMPSDEGPGTRLSDED